ncbi:MAG TPA: DUF1588 domain-containing protein [Polyangiaceae bacterium]|nr:DUF1588 domain-containing protein [Polyangiaceae bacterium]
MKFKTRTVGAACLGLVGLLGVGCAKNGVESSGAGKSTGKGAKDDTEAPSKGGPTVVTLPDGGTEVVAQPAADGGVTLAPAGADGCLSNREFLATEAWPKVLGGVCSSCHGPGGTAVVQGAKFTLEPSAYPGFIDVNLQAVATNAELEVDGKSVLLLKPLGEREHGGGAVLAKDSEGYRILTELVERVKAGEKCPDDTAIAHFDDVQLLDPAGTFRKAALTLAGRLPTANEVSALRDGGEQALPAAIEGLFTEAGFHDRLIEMFNDQWLTDRYLDDGTGLLNGDEFPNIQDYYDNLPDDQKYQARRSVAREPLELMAHVVLNDRPFTEIVTADYTVLNPFTAVVYNNGELAFKNEYDANEYQEGRIYAVEDDGKLLAFPHAGILSSPMFLNRYPTSRTNLNRHRARIVLRELLATDILKVANRPIDPTKAVTFANPTREEESCKMCHVIIDPIAGTFQHWDDNDYERIRLDEPWHDELFPPGIGDEKLTAAEAESGNGLPWLGSHIAADPRFPISVVQNLYRSLIGEEPMAFPADPSDGSYAAWEAQQATLRAIAQAFVEDNFNFKTAVLQVVLSPYFRAANTDATSSARLAQLAAVGTGRLLTPELLDRKITQVFGFSWNYGGDRTALSDDFKILYGGIDSETVTERLSTPNGMMSAISWRMATEMACHGTALDFAQAASDRRLFPNVETSTVPEDEIAQAIPENVAKIQQNLAYLYERMLGETLDPESSEGKRIYDLFLTTWREGRAKLASTEVQRDLNWECQYRRKPGADEDLPDAQMLTQDDNYVIRSWMAVITYLLSDYRFLYD